MHRAGKYKSAWLISEADKPVQLTTVMHQGRLHYRFPGTGRRISYWRLKKGLIKTKRLIYLPVALMPF